MYIHYGSTSFDIYKFCPIRNRRYFPKPYGGLWASPINTKMGWNNWCDKENFRECTKSNSFVFDLTGANVLFIDSKLKAEGIPRLRDEQYDMLYPEIFPDFEEIQRLGYDAVELSLSSCPDLYFVLYGWDCDSIVILNPNVVKEVSRCA